MTTQTYNASYAASEASVFSLYLSRVLALFSSAKTDASWADGAFYM
jgi:hypothetical protein